MDKFIVMTAAAHMPSSCKYGPYKKVAIVETNGVDMPKQIHPRHKAVVRIVALWDRLWVGNTERSAYARALREAESMVQDMNRRI